MSVKKLVFLVLTRMAFYWIISSSSSSPLFSRFKKNRFLSTPLSQLPQHPHSKIMNTLPKRIFGRPCGLLHQRLLKDLLAVDFFFKRPTSDEAVNYNSLLLSNAIHSVYKNTCFVILLANFGNKHAAFSYLYFKKSFGKLRFTRD